MPTTDKQATDRPRSRFLALLRDTLFEPESREESDSRPELEASRATAHDADAAGAARAALLQNLAEQAGPALSEFTLQLEALRDALPDERARRRAALRVLSLKGIAVQTLVLELEGATAALAAQRQAFAAKVDARRAAIERQQSDAVAALERETAEAERNATRLEAEAAAERTKISDATARRERLFVECEESRSDLANKQRGFERAFAELSAEYGALQQALVQPESS